MERQAPDHNILVSERLPDTSFKLAERKIEILIHSLSDAEYADFIASISRTLIYKAMLKECPKSLIGFVLYHALPSSEFNAFIRKVETIIENRK